MKASAPPAAPSAPKRSTRRSTTAKRSFDDAVACALDEDQKTPHGTRIGNATTLTKREWQVAELVSEGLTNRAIADKLVISPRTSQGHVEHVLTKLGFTSRAQIAAWVVEQSTRQQPQSS
ncbi:helix-turn-helix transcriptional regulator [Rhodococcus opacus]|uniref:response regulator transcription factor n=1 Tax=Rhodococcus TaxID=1827 RepID=UPI001F0D2C57|nr:helix-turn-helix transcriptional regulator [Rhodococcus opacus]MDV6247806.1 helix-turn-helix transcriptional regulator [Rhodococcus opacus]